MPSDLNTALLVSIVGMSTVFVILSLVVLSGRFLIRLVNRYAPEVAISKKTISPLISRQPEGDISPSVMAAIVAAVEQITEGSGKVNKIEKDK